MGWVNLENSEIYIDIHDNNFYSILKRVISNWFDVDIKELPGILRLMGVERGIYRLDKREMDTTMVSMFISTDDQKKYTLQLFRGDMVNPYPTWVLIDMDRQLRNCFFVKMKVEVEKISTIDFNGRFVDDD